MQDDELRGRFIKADGGVYHQIMGVYPMTGHFRLVQEDGTSFMYNWDSDDIIMPADWQPVKEEDDPSRSPSIPKAAKKLYDNPDDTYTAEELAEHQLLTDEDAADIIEDGLETLVRRGVIIRTESDDGAIFRWNKDKRVAAIYHRWLARQHKKGIK